MTEWKSRKMVFNFNASSSNNIHFAHVRAAAYCAPNLSMEDFRASLLEDVLILDTNMT